MELSEIRNKLEAYGQKVEDFRGSLDLDRLEEEIALLDNDMAEPDFWNDNEAAQKVIDESNALKAKYENFMSIATLHEDSEVMLEMLQEEDDEDMQVELEENVEKLGKKIETYELEIMLNQPYDHMNAILEIHPGSGGQSHKIGAACSCACMSAGALHMASRWKFWIIKMEMLQV